MSETGGMLDAYLICQALGWEWNFTSMIILTLAPILIIVVGLFSIFVLFPFILDLISRWIE